jgi:sec-independent protein translocase protein TatC
MAKIVPLHQKAEKKSKLSQPMSLLEHLIELRQRLMACLLMFVISAGIAYYFAEPLFSFLVMPLAKVLDHSFTHRLIYTGLSEAFVTYVKVALFTGAFFSFPFVMVQVWRFIAPGLYQHERKVFFKFIVFTPLLFLTGAAFAYFIIIPSAWRFFLQFESPGQAGSLPIQLEAKLSEYLSMTLQLLFAFGLCFLLPILVLLLNRIGIMSIDLLTHSRRYAFLLILILSAVLTPPDVLSMIGLAVPLYLLYEISIMLVKLTEKRQQQLNIKERRA